MAANYVLLEKVTVGSGGTTSVTFSSIPQTGYTDLVVRISCRTARASSANAGLMVKLNNSTTGYSSIEATYDGGGVASYSNLFNAGYVINTAGAAVDASVFTNQEIYIPNYASANYKTFSSQSIVENTGTGARNEMMATTWANTDAITSIVFGEYAGNSIDQYSTFYLYGVAKLNTTPVIVPYATGGDTIMTDGTYWYHAFKANGTFTPAKGLSCDYLVVAGGGGGGRGAGGAGGYRSATTQTFNSGTGYTVTIGGGGGAFSGGSLSSIAGTGMTTFASSAGGAGGGAPSNGGNGGSGGGGGGGVGGGSGLGNSGSYTPSEGNNGGTATASTMGGGGGGGGAGGTGSNATSTGGGNGGAGSNAHSSWLSVVGSGVSGFLAGGGGGTGSTSQGTGGSGGGGNGGYNDTGVSGVANTGSGGGGGYNGGFGSGGSGLVIVRYAV